MWKKIIIGFVIFIFLLLAAAISLPFIYKGKIMELVKKEANKNLNATVNFDNHIKLSILRSFPNLTLEIKNLTVINKEPFKGDTLAFIKNFKTTLDIMSVIKGEKIKIYAININESKIYLHILADGKANWDIALPDTSPVKTPADTISTFKMNLKKYAITKSTLIYKDESSKMLIKMEDFDHTGSGDLTADIYDLNTHTIIAALTYNYDGVNYLYKTNTDLTAILNINMKEMKFTFKDNLLKLNEFFLKFDGYLLMPKDDIAMDISFDAPKTDFKNLISLIPAVYSKDFKDLKTMGKMAFNGKVKGIYNSHSMPGFNVNIQVSNGMFQYPSLPAAINQVNFDLKVNCPDGIFDHTIIDMKQMHFALDKEPFDARLLVKTPVSDPYIDAAVKGKIDLGQVKNFIPLEKGTNLAGILNANIAMKGNLSTIEKQKYEQFDATGNLTFTNLTYSAPDLLQQINVPEMRLDFSPKLVTLQNMKATIGQSDISARGNLSNFLAYFFGKGTLKGEININSGFLDMNSLLSSSSTTQTTTDTSVSITAPILPANIEFNMNSTFNRLLYDKIDAKNVQCRLILKDKILTISNLSMNVFGGSIQIVNGSYSSVNPDKPKVIFNIALKNFDIAQAFTTFMAVKQFAPIAKFAKGSFDARLEFTTDMLKNLKPDLMSLFSVGNLKIERITIEGFKPVQKMAEALKMDKFKTLTMQNISPSYEIREGVFKLKPINFKVDQSEFNVEGTNNLDKTMNYLLKIKIPAKELSSQATSAISQMSNNKLNLNLGDFITMHVKITGSIDNPKIETSLNEIKETVKEQVKGKVNEELNKQKTQIENKANEELNKQKQLLEQKAKQEMEQQRKKAEEEAKRKIQEEAKKKLKKLF